MSDEDDYHTLDEGLLASNPSVDEEEEADTSWTYIFFVNVFFACVSFSIIMPSLWPYLQDMHAPRSFLAWVVAIYSVGEALGSLAFGVLYNMTSPKFTILLSLCTGLVGCIMYVAADVPKSYWLVFGARLVQGLWSGGQQTAEQCYLSVAVKGDQRTEMTATLGSFAVMGFVLGPAFGAAFASVNFTVAGFQVTNNNAPALFIVFTSVASIVCTAIMFRPDNAKAKAGAAAQRQQAEEEAEAGLRREPPCTLGLLVCLFAFFVHFYSFAIQETITTPLVQDLYGWITLCSEVTVPYNATVNLLAASASTATAASTTAAAATATSTAAATTAGATAASASSLLSLPLSAVLPRTAAALRRAAGAAAATVGTAPLSAAATSPSSFAVSAAAAQHRELLCWQGLTGSQFTVDMLFTGSGILSLLTAIAVKYLSRAFSDLTLLFTSLVIGAVGSFVLVDYTGSLPLPVFLTGFAIITVAFPFGRGVTLSTYSQIIGPTPQGFFMGAMFTVGAIPRIVGPFWAVYALQLAPTHRHARWVSQPTDTTGQFPGRVLYDGPIPRTWLEFGSGGVMFLICLVVVFLARRSLVPYEQYIETLEDGEYTSQALRSPIAGGSGGSESESGSMSTGRRLLKRANSAFTSPMQLSADPYRTPKLVHSNSTPGTMSPRYRDEEGRTTFLLGATSSAAGTPGSGRRSYGTASGAGSPPPLQLH